MLPLFWGLFCHFKMPALFIEVVNPAINHINIHHAITKHEILSVCTLKMALHKLSKCSNMKDVWLGLYFPWMAIRLVISIQKVIDGKSNIDLSLYLYWWELYTRCSHTIIRSYHIIYLLFISMIYQGDLIVHRYNSDDKVLGSVNIHTSINADLCQCSEQNVQS